MEHSEAFIKAVEIIGQDPLPDDAEQRLNDLEKLINEDEAEKFGDIWEAFMAASGTHTTPPVPE